MDDAIVASWPVVHFFFLRSIAVRVAAPWPRPEQLLACFGPSLQMPPSVSSVRGRAARGICNAGRGSDNWQKRKKKREAFTRWGLKGEGGRQVVLLTRAKVRPTKMIDARRKRGKACLVGRIQVSESREHLTTAGLAFPVKGMQPTIGNRGPQVPLP